MLARSRVSKLFVMRSLLRRDEEAHRPELYLADNESDTFLPRQTSNSDSEYPDNAAAAASGDDDFPGALLWRGGGGGGTGERKEWDGEEGGAAVGGGRRQEKVATRYHRQLRRYREHLRDQVI